MDRLVQHDFEVGQVWQTPDGLIYVMSVNDDKLDEDGTPVEPGKVFVTDTKPVPGKSFSGYDLGPTQFQGLVEAYAMTKTDIDWRVEFQQREAAIAANLAASGKGQPPAPVQLKTNGLGAMAQR